MKKAEAKLREFFRDHINYADPRGIIECDGRGSFAGQFEAGQSERSSFDFGAMLYEQREFGGADIVGDFSSLIQQLHEESRAHEFGPFYRLDIKLAGKKIGFEYSWENAPGQSLDQLTPSLRGKIPEFVFERRFDEELIALADDEEIDTAVSAFVTARRRQGATVPESLLDMYALINWHLMTVSEGFDAHFSNLESGALQMPPIEWYERLIRISSRLHQKDTIELIELSIGMYASVYKVAEQIRSSLGIESVSKVDEDDLYDRLGIVDEPLQSAWREEIRGNSARYLVSD